MKMAPRYVIEDLMRNYEPHFVEAMLNPERMDKILNFIERNQKEITVTYAQVFFSPNGFDIYELNGERRIFCAPTNIFECVPLTSEDAVGDWQSWLKKASKIKEIR